ncbi:hypothetical protein [Gordonia araii]|uniref:hypothetical protein n=1 Tax=Gordonia araii TaxID=263909 RepID=UPI0014780666|nr:hypothetical protein [Gordonia araii]NNG98877.1 hypothetical protein [Gordonia araii NBRC 100433]
MAGVMLAAAIVAIPSPAAAPAHAACSAYDPDGSINWSCGWQLPKFPKPRAPKFNMGGPRPPLTPKNSVWCTSNFVNMGNGTGWTLTHVTKYDIRFWPDYYRRTYQGVDWTGYGWRRLNTYERVDCDA